MIFRIICILLLGFTSCGNVNPAGFWENFHQDALLENVSVQGLNGGHRSMYWEFNHQEVTLKDVMSFSSANGWKLIDSFSFGEDEVKSWLYQSSPIFPLSHQGFSSALIQVSTYKNFPRWIDTGFNVYTFETGWVMIQPGTDETFDVNGFVVLSNEGSKMSVYHLWGE